MGQLPDEVNRCGTFQLEKRRIRRSIYVTEVYKVNKFLNQLMVECIHQIPYCRN